MQSIAIDFLHTFVTVYINGIPNVRTHEEVK